MAQGFNAREAAAERSLEKSSKELKMLRKVIEKYKDDPKGKKKMLKKMQKYWRSPIATIKGLDYKPKGEDWQLDPEIADNIKGMQEYIDPRGDEHDATTVLTDEQESELRDIMTKTTNKDD